MNDRKQTKSQNSPPDTDDSGAYASLMGDAYIRSLLSRNLRRLRKKYDMSQIELAVESGLAHNFINDIENGKKWISAASLAKLSMALKTDPHQLFISEPSMNDQVAQTISFYLDDFSESLEMMTEKYRNRLFGEGSGNPQDPKKSQ